MKFQGGMITPENIEQAAEAIRDLLSQGPYTSVHVYDGHLSSGEGGVHMSCKLREVKAEKRSISIDDGWLTWITAGDSVYFERDGLRVEGTAGAGTNIQRVYKLEKMP